MSKKRRSPAPPAQAAKANPLLDFGLPLLGGALAALCAAGMLGVSAALLWKPVAEDGGLLLRVIAFMSVCGGAIAGAIGREKILGTPLAAAGAALGWALWGLSAHVGLPGQFLTLLPKNITEPVADTIFFSNAMTHALVMALGVVLTAVSARVVARFLGRDGVPSPSTGKANFRNALSYPALLMVAGGVFFLLCGLAAMPLGYVPPQKLPGEVFPALWCGLWTLIAFGLAGFLVRRYFATTGSIGYAIAPPLTVAALATLVVKGGLVFPLIQPAILLLWHSSAFEAAAWGSLGSCLGYMLATRTKVES